MVSSSPVVRKHTSSLLPQQQQQQQPQRVSFENGRAPRKGDQLQFNSAANIPTSGAAALQNALRTAFVRQVNGGDMWRKARPTHMCWVLWTSAASCCIVLQVLAALLLDAESTRSTCTRHCRAAAVLVVTIMPSCTIILTTKLKYKGKTSCFGHTPRVVRSASNGAS